MIKSSASIRKWLPFPMFILVDEHAFESLEHPELFKDGLHLNREGVAQFSAMLARTMRNVLGPLPGTDSARRRPGCFLTPPHSSCF